MVGLAVGRTTGVIGTGSLAFNDALLNSSTSTGTPITLGTGVNNRLGKHIFFNRLVVRWRVAHYNPFRVIIARNFQDGSAANQLTNSNLTALVESTTVLEGASASYGGSGGYGTMDTMVSPSTDYEILWDHVYGTGPESIPTSSGPTSTSVEIDIPLNLQRIYTQTPSVDSGGWFIYVCSTEATASSCSISGWLRVQYINQFSFEALGKGVRSFVNEAGQTIKHVAQSDFLRYALKAAPYVFGF
jgi:hypothetical protein